jgi:hypothetical protein
MIRNDQIRLRGYGLECMSTRIFPFIHWVLEICFKKRVARYSDLRNLLSDVLYAIVWSLQGIMGFTWYSERKVPCWAHRFHFNFNDLEYHLKNLLAPFNWRVLILVSLYSSL